MTTIATQFRVIAVSSNANSFGLHQYIAVARNGEAYKLHTCSQFCPKKGDDLTLEFNLNERTGKRTFRQVRGVGVEMPEKIVLSAPKEVLAEIYK